MGMFNVSHTIQNKLFGGNLFKYKESEAMSVKNLKTIMTPLKHLFIGQSILRENSDRS